jgi:hypothetical protein
MEKTVDETKQHYRRLIAENVYLNRDIKYSPEMDNDFLRGDHSFGSYVSGSLKKISTLDIDDTLGVGPHLGERVIHFLGTTNSIIGTLVDDLYECVRKLSDPIMEKLERNEYIKKYCGILTRGRMHRVELDHASEKAAENMELVTNSEKLVPALGRRGYIIRLSTGSPKSSAVYLGEKKLGISAYGVSPQYGVYDLISGTEFGFDSKGYFNGEIISGLQNKGETMLNVHKYYGSSHHLFVFMSDDYKSKSEKEAASIAGLTIWAVNKSVFEKNMNKKGFEYPGNIKLACPDARNNMDVLTDTLLRWDRFNVQIYLINPQNQMKLLDLATDFRQSYENATRSNIVLPYDKARFLDIAYQLQALIQSTNLKDIRNIDIYESLIELNNSTSPATDKKIIEDINSRLEDALPETRVPKRFCDVLRGVVNEAELYSEMEWSLSC